MYRIIKKSKLAVICLLSCFIMVFSPSIALAGSVYYDIGPISKQPFLWSIKYGLKSYPYNLSLYESVDKGTSVQTPFYHEASGVFYRNLYPFTWKVTTQNNYYSGTTRKLGVSSWKPISSIYPAGWSAFGGYNGTGVTLALTGSYVENMCTISIPDDGTTGNYTYKLYFTK